MSYLVKAFRVTHSAGNKSIELRKKTISKKSAALLCVILQDCAQIFLNKAVKDQRHRLAAQLFFDRGPFDRCRRVFVQFRVASQSLRYSFILFR
ncbi:MAG TPA: hypothetical protein PLN52_01550 [Opitutaceae bacterium]|nr:hypothetical protein [Opitutaceae bacterium]